MSALSPKADIVRRHCHVRLVPRGDIGAPCYGVSIPCRAMICRDRSPRQMKAVGA